VESREQERRAETSEERVESEYLAASSEGAASTKLERTEAGEQRVEFRVKSRN
jgi:hypothetical protein